MDEDDTPVDAIVEVEIGWDAVKAHLIAEALRADGVDIELRLMDSNGMAPGQVALMPHRVMVRLSDLDLAMLIIDRWTSANESGEADGSIGGSTWLRIRAGVLLAVMIGAMVLAIVAVVGSF